MSGSVLGGDRTNLLRAPSAGRETEPPTGNRTLSVHILVCIKQVLDQEIAPADFRIDRAAKTADVPGAALVMSIFCANALETALKLRDAAGSGSTVTALSLGPKSAEEVLRKAFSVSANKLMLLSDPALTGLDSAGVATAIAAAVRRLEAEGTPVDVVLVGRQAGDWEHGQTAGMVAEALGWPCLTLVSQIRPAGDGFELRREVEDGYVTIGARAPFVASITNDPSNQLRLAKVRELMLANRAKIPTLSAADLGLDAARLAPRVEVVDLDIPMRESNCEFIEGDKPEEVAQALAQRLREMKLV